MVVIFTMIFLHHKRSYSLGVVRDVVYHHNNNMVVWHAVLVEDLVGVAHIGLGRERIMRPGGVIAIEFLLITLDLKVKIKSEIKLELKIASCGIKCAPFSSSFISVSTNSGTKRVHFDTSFDYYYHASDLCLTSTILG